MVWAVRLPITVNTHITNECMYECGLYNIKYPDKECVQIRKALRKDIMTGWSCKAHLFCEWSKKSPTQLKCTSFLYVNGSDVVIVICNCN